jgi:glycosyltransferase involved in cell wall biosynthesis
MRETVSDAAFSGRYDLLQFEYLQMAQFLPERSPVPMLLTHHEVQSLALQRALRHLPKLSIRRFKKTLHWMQMLRYELTRLPQFNQVIVLSEEDREYLLRYLPSLRLVVNHMGVDCSHFHPLRDPKDPYSLVFVGYFKHEPNVDAAYWLINKIFPQVAARFPKARLSLVGNEPPPELKGRLNGLNITITGWVPDIREYLGHCAIFVAPLRLGAGMRGKMLEAWAMGAPIVCTSIACAGMADAQHGKNLLVADDEVAFANHICRLLDDEGLRRRLGQEGLKTVRAQYDWERQIQEHKTIYERILG